MITIKRILKFVIFLVLLSDVSFFYLFDLPNQMLGYSQKFLIVIFIFVTLIILLISKAKMKINYRFKFEIIFILYLMFSQIIISYFAYGQKISDILRVSNHYFIILFYVILIIYIEKTQDVKFVFNTIILFTIILSTLFIMQYILHKTGVEVLFVGYDRLRFGSLRIYESSYFIIIGSILSFTYVINGKNKKSKLFGIIGLLLGLSSTFFVYKGRSAIVFCIITILIICLLKYKTKIYKIIPVIVIFVALFLTVLRPMVEQYIDSVNYKDNSIIVRDKALDFYIEQIKQKPILGVGIIRADEQDESFYVLRGFDGTYYRSDFGIIGFINSFGLLGALFYICIIVKISYYLIKFCRYYSINDVIEIVSILIFVLLTSFSVTIMDAERIIILPILLSYSNYYYNRLKENII